MGQCAFEPVSTRDSCKTDCSRTILHRQSLKVSLPSAVNETMPLRPMHILDPVYPQLPMDSDWGLAAPNLENNTHQSAASLEAFDIFQWDSASQMPMFSSTPYSQSDQQQCYVDAADQSFHIFSELVEDPRNSTYVPSSSFSDNWSSQPLPRIRGHSTCSDNTQSTDFIHWDGRPQDGSGYEPGGLSCKDGGVIRGIYPKI